MGILGVRRVEFDPDVLRSRDVRILVDGKRAAEMPYPTSDLPHREVTFQLGDHVLVAVAQLAVEPDQITGAVLTYDLFTDGRSLSGGASLELTRASAPSPGTAYPASFQVIDAIFLVIPAVVGSGLGVALARSAEELGWQGTISFLAGLLAVLVAGRAIGVRTWSRVRADTIRSVTRRAALGALIALPVEETACYRAADHESGKLNPSGSTHPFTCE